jgi:hypothetical protein
MPILPRLDVERVVRAGALIAGEGARGPSEELEWSSALKIQPLDQTGFISERKLQR